MDNKESAEKQGMSAHMFLVKKGIKSIGDTTPAMTTEMWLNEYAAQQTAELKAEVERLRETIPVGLAKIERLKKESDEIFNEWKVNYLERLESLCKDMAFEIDRYIVADGSINQDGMRAILKRYTEHLNKQQ